MLLRPAICAQSAWRGNLRECEKLYRQFINDFGGSFAKIRAYYGWKRRPMVRALRLGKPA